MSAESLNMFKQLIAQLDCIFTHSNEVPNTYYKNKVFYFQSIKRIFSHAWLHMLHLHRLQLTGGIIFFI